MSNLLSKIFYVSIFFIYVLNILNELDFCLFNYKQEDEYKNLYFKLKYI